VDFDYMSRKEIIKVAVEMDTPSSPALLDSGSELRSTSSIPGVVPEGEGSEVASPSGRGRREAPGEGEFEERWTGSYIFENEWQSFRTRKDRNLELKSAPHTYTTKGRYTVAVKVIDIFGNDTMVLVPVNVG
jgi:site-specific DNA-methyltransferase (adenine-specific)/adenine-specific DNA-methyltransferase